MLHAHALRISAWLLDLAKTLPSSTQLDGFDLSASQYPHKLLLPSNVSLQTLDATNEPPQELQGKYDVVHLRLFLIVINNNDPTPILNHCFKLLSKHLTRQASLQCLSVADASVQSRVDICNGMSTI